MRLAFVPTEGSNEHALFYAGETATELFEQDGAETVVTNGGGVNLSSEPLYRVDFEASGETTFERPVTSAGAYSIFTERVPEEFDAALRPEAVAEITPSLTGLDSGHSHGDDSHSHVQ